MLPIEDSCEIDLDLEKCRSTLAKGAELGIETPDGQYNMVFFLLYFTIKFFVIYMHANFICNRGLRGKISVNRP